jgi:hypothetical protein
VAIVSDDANAPRPHFEPADIEGVADAVDVWLQGLAGD